MKQRDVIGEQRLSVDLLSGIYRECLGFFSKYLGDVKSTQLMQFSYQTILPYFPNLAHFQIDDTHQVQYQAPRLTETDFLAFTVWMQQFVKEAKNMLVGAGKIDIRQITKSIEAELETVGFFEFYRQAGELDY